MQIFLVGGAVRNMLLGLPVNDFDYLVQGCTEQEFRNLFPEAKQVGAAFPVFLVDGEEYAFARVEKKTGEGHKGFSTETENVSVMEDLLRRDLTINSIALCPETGAMVGAPGAFKDLEKRVLRHTSEAFGEDPLRVLRVARFAAQLPQFSVANETMFVMRALRRSLKDLSAERVFEEMKKALIAPAPRRFFEVLKEANKLSYWFPELENLIRVPAGPKAGKHEHGRDTFDHTMNVISGVENNPVLRFAGLCHDLGKALSAEPPKHRNHDTNGIPLVAAFCDRLRVPAKWKKVAMLFTAEHLRMHRIFDMRPGKAVELLQNISKVMPLEDFLSCSVGDGMSPQEKQDLIEISSKVLSVKLPEKYVGRGVVCKEILLQLRGEMWKSLTK
jgi:tRNA nucleotidyltransferase (CCA-adding enzyme)